MTIIIRRFAKVCAALLALCAAQTPVAQGTGSNVARPLSLEHQVEFDIPPQALSTALVQFSRQSGVQIITAAKDVEGLASVAIKGRLSIRDAASRLLEGTGLSFKLTREGTIVVAKRDSAESTPQGAAQLAQQVAKGETITVTGTNIRGAKPVGAPLTVITRDEIEQSGYASVPELVWSLPQNFAAGANEATFSLSLNQNAGFTNTYYGSGINLRGLGDFGTLTLINGRRGVRSGGRGGSIFDVSMIPIAAVDRVEILTDGASALYGADAIAGVVNFHLRNDFEGGETLVQVGSVTSGDMKEYQLGHTQGWVWGTGNALVSGEFYRRDRLKGSDRAFFSDDLRALGGPDLRSTFSNPANIVRGATVFGIPRGQDGRALTPSALSTTRNLADGKEEYDILPLQERGNVFLSASQNFGPSVRAFGEATYGSRRFTAYVGPAVSILTVPTTHPFYVNPFGGTPAAIQVTYNWLRDLGPQIQSGHSKVYSGTLGLEFDLPFRWSGEIYGAYGKSDEDQTQTNRVNSFFQNQALADRNPATTLNPFGDGSFTDPATLDRIRGYTKSFGTAELTTAAAKMSGSLLALPAGAVQAAVGAEYRREDLQSVSHLLISTATPAISTLTDTSRSVSAGFAELRMPLVSGKNRRPAIEELALSVAGRVENYSDFGSTSNPKVGVTWSPVADLTVRGTYGTSFRAPSSLELTNPSQQVVRRNDPSSPTGSTVVLLLTGRSADLGPEEATVWTGGFDFAPRSFPGLKLGATYFSIAFDNRIANLATISTTLLSDSGFAALVQRNPSLAEVTAYTSLPTFLGYGAGINPVPGSVQAIGNVTIQNVSLEKQRGLDFDLAYDMRTAIGQVGLGLTGTRLFDFTQQVAISSPQVRRLNTLNYPVDLKMRARATWAKGPWAAAVFVNYTADYRNETVTPVARVGSWTTIDLHARFTPEGIALLKGTTLSLHVKNLFDRDPPFALFTFARTQGLSAVGYDPQQATALGRFVSLNLTKRW